MQVMEGELGRPFDRDDGKYFSGLSTILVATIQEAKDRISQIEYVFCSQIYPDFQSRSKSLERSFSETMKAAEDEWRKKEVSYLHQIEKLTLEKQQLLEENKKLMTSLELDKAKVPINGRPLEENDRNKKPLLGKVESLKDNVDDLQEKLTQKDKEVEKGNESQRQLLNRIESIYSVIVDKEKLLKKHEEEKELLLGKLEGLEKDLDMKTKEVGEVTDLHGKLIRTIELKTTVIANKTKQLSAHEEREKELIAKLEDQEEKIHNLERVIKDKNEKLAEGREVQVKLHRMIEAEAFANMKNRGLLNEKVDKLEEELRKKNDEVIEGRDLQEKLLKKIELCTSEIASKTEENKLVSAKLKGLEDSVNRYEEELRKKYREVAERKKLYQALVQKIEIDASEMMNKEHLLKEHEEEKEMLLAKLRSIEEKVNEHQEELRERNEEVVKGREAQEKLLLEIELKTSEVLIEKQKMRDMVASYKRLKSQYNFLCEKSGFTTENMLPRNRMDEESNSSAHHQDPTIPQDSATENPEASGFSSDTSKQQNNITFQQVMENDRQARIIQSSNSHSPSTSGSPIVLKHPINVQTGPLAGMKRPNSYWRETRSRQDQGGPDPHDDFLDTPLENAKEIMKNKDRTEAVHDFPVPAPKDMCLDSSEDETQDTNGKAGLGKVKIPTSKPNSRSFKYVEPVRKKAERENLKGVECKQCKKFYDAVLPDGGSKGSDSNCGFRCEHLDGVSRHRYRYVPPMTPEGFWNIGFDSEF